VTISLAEPADAIDGKFLLTLQTNAGAGGKSENVFGFDFAPGACVLGARRAAAPKQTSGRALRHGVTSLKLGRHMNLSRSRHFLIDASANGLPSYGQKDSL
jgi:hypothetical protein